LKFIKNYLVLEIVHGIARVDGLLTTKRMHGKRSNNCLSPKKGGRKKKKKERKKEINKLSNEELLHFIPVSLTGFAKLPSFLLFFLSFWRLWPRPRPSSFLLSALSHVRGPFHPLPHSVSFPIGLSLPLLSSPKCSTEEAADSTAWWFSEYTFYNTFSIQRTTARIFDLENYPVLTNLNLFPEGFQQRCWPLQPGKQAGKGAITLSH
jgi:hypothetical protein